MMRDPHAPVVLGQASKLTKSLFIWFYADFWGLTIFGGPKCNPMDPVCIPSGDGD